MVFPADLKYTPDHEWIKLLDNGQALVGITDFAQRELDELVYIEVDSVGETLKKGEIFGTVQAGALEVSNVDLTNELAMMIRAQQIYNANSRALQTEVDLGKRLIDG